MNLDVAAEINLKLRCVRIVQNHKSSRLHNAWCSDAELYRLTSKKFVDLYRYKCCSPRWITYLPFHVVYLQQLRRMRQISIGIWIIALPSHLPMHMIDDYMYSHGMAQYRKCVLFEETKDRNGLKWLEILVWKNNIQDAHIDEPYSRSYFVHKLAPHRSKYDPHSSPLSAPTQTYTPPPPTELCRLYYCEAMTMCVCCGILSVF